MLQGLPFYEAFCNIATDVICTVTVATLNCKVQAVAAVVAGSEGSKFKSNITVGLLTRTAVPTWVACISYIKVFVPSDNEAVKVIGATPAPRGTTLIINRDRSANIPAA